MTFFDKLLNTGVSRKKNREKKNPDSHKQEFKEEFSEVLATNVSPLDIQTYTKAGVSFEKLSETRAKIKYSGQLAQNGAQNIRAVYGYGSNQQWENISEAELIKEGAGTFSALLPLEEGKNLNMIFKDNFDNLDNNSGMNYTFVN